MKLKRLLLWFFMCHIIVYTCWVFIVLDFKEPLNITFATSISRGCYLFFLFACLVFSIPFVDRNSDYNDYNEIENE